MLFQAFVTNVAKAVYIEVILEHFKLNRKGVATVGVTC